MIEFNRMKQTQEFARLLPKLLPEQVMGVAKLLGVKTVFFDENGTNPSFRDGSDIIVDCIDAFYIRHKGARKNLLAIMKVAANNDKITEEEMVKVGAQDTREN